MKSRARDVQLTEQQREQLKRRADASWVESSQPYALLRIEAGMDYVIVEGTRIERPSHIARSAWLSYWGDAAHERG